MEMYTQHTREKHIKTKTCLKIAPKRDQTQNDSVCVSVSQGHDTLS